MQGSRVSLSFRHLDPVLGQNAEKRHRTERACTRNDEMELVVVPIQRSGRENPVRSFGLL